MNDGFIFFYKNIDLIIIFVRMKNKFENKEFLYWLVIYFMYKNLDWFVDNFMWGIVFLVYDKLVLK